MRTKDLIVCLIHFATRSGWMKGQTEGPSMHSNYWTPQGTVHNKRYRKCFIISSLHVSSDLSFNIWTYTWSVNSTICWLRVKPFDLLCWHFKAIFLIICLRFSTGFSIPSLSTMKCSWNAVTYCCRGDKASTISPLLWRNVF